ncbi:FAD-dependent oxidoreductase [Lacticaseibacillus saniviri]
MITTDLLIIGGSDAGISAALRARELDDQVCIILLLSDDFPNFSICGIPYALSGEVTDWHHLAHRTRRDLEAYHIAFHSNTVADKIDSEAHQVLAHNSDGSQVFAYQKLLVATGARPKSLGVTAPTEATHVLRTMADFFAIEDLLTTNQPERVAIVGAGYVGLEVTEALTKRGIAVTMIQRGQEVLSTVDSAMGQKVHHVLSAHGVAVLTDQTVTEIKSAEKGYMVTTSADETIHADLILVVIGVVPNSQLLAQAGAQLDAATRAVKVDDAMRTSLPDIYAAGDLVLTKHRLLGNTYLPLGTTAHKQGRIAGATMLGRSAVFQGVLGSQVVTIFGLVTARTGLTEAEARTAGFDPVVSTSYVDDHKAYYPNAHQITIRLIADRQSGQLLGAQLMGQATSEVAKRTDIFATAIYHHMTVAEFSDLDLTYSPVVGSPWDAVQLAAQALERQL